MSGTIVPVILLTQVEESVERVMTLEGGNDDYLNKPFTPHELLVRMRTVLCLLPDGRPLLLSDKPVVSGNWDVLSLLLDRLAYTGVIIGIFFRTRTQGKRQEDISGAQVLVVEEKRRYF